LQSTNQQRVQRIYLSQSTSNTPAENITEKAACHSAKWNRGSEVKEEEGITKWKRKELRC